MKKYRYKLHLSHLEIIHEDGEISRVQWSDLRTEGKNIHPTPSALLANPKLPGKIAIGSRLFEKRKWIVAWQLITRGLRQRLDDGTLDLYWSTPTDFIWLRKAGIAAFNILNILFCIAATGIFVSLGIVLLIGLFSDEPDISLFYVADVFQQRDRHLAIWLTRCICALGIRLVWIAGTCLLWILIIEMVRQTPRLIREVNQRQKHPKILEIRATSSGLDAAFDDGNRRTFIWSELKRVSGVSAFDYACEDTTTVVPRITCPRLFDVTWQRLIHIVDVKFSPKGHSRRVKRKPVKPEIPWIMSIIVACVTIGIFWLIEELRSSIPEFATEPGLPVVKASTIILMSTTLVFYWLRYVALRFFSRQARQARRRND